MKSYPLFINGEWIASKSDQRTTVHSPSTGEPIATIQNGNKEDAAIPLEAGKEATGLSNTSKKKHSM